MNYKILNLLFLCLSIRITKSQSQAGPDPWNYDSQEFVPMIRSDVDLPPDLKLPSKRKVLEDRQSTGIGELSFRRTLAILLKGGLTKENEDGSVDISLQMKFDKERWSTLNEYLKSDTSFSDDMFRRTLGYVQEAIYKPTITEKIIMAWTDYIQIYLAEYKVYITWMLGLSGVMGALIWLWGHMSHRHVIIIVFIVLYVYEVIVSYKEAEQRELQRFISAVNTCKWYFWTSSCEVPSPDLVVFMKHMNPLKIAIRLFTTLISEPMICLSESITVIIHGMTDGLWFPFDKIAYGILTVSINILLIVLLIMIMFNYILNIKFNLGFFGLFNIKLQQRNRTFSPLSSGNNEPHSVDDTERIRGATLHKILDVCSRALDNRTNERVHINVSSNLPKIKRSASTGRLPNAITSIENNDRIVFDNKARRRHNAAFRAERDDGSGDAH